jgi:hypothetical protein
MPVNRAGAVESEIDENNGIKATTLGLREQGPVRPEEHTGHTKMVHGCLRRMLSARA